MEGADFEEAEGAVGCVDGGFDAFSHGVGTQDASCTPDGGSGHGGD